MKKIIRLILMFLPTKIYLKITFRYRMGYSLNLKNPSTYNEKLQWLKLNDRNSKYSKLVDKYEVRDYIAKTIGQKYLVPLYGVYDDFKNINLETLPNKFVMKTTHNSGGVFICKNKKEIKYDKLKKNFKKWMNYNHYLYDREYPYKNIKPRIIIEKLLENSNGLDLSDYKILCFGGEPKYIEVMSDRHTVEGYKVNYFDVKWNELDIERENKLRNTKKFNKPKNLDEMLKVAKVLSKGLKFVRVDLYNIDGKIYFGELTFYPASGYVKFKDKNISKHFGDLIEIN